MIQEILHNKIKNSITELYSISEHMLQFQNTRKDFVGDITLVVFNLLPFSKKDAEHTAKQIGEYLIKNVSEISSYNVIKGFLNIEISKDFWFKSFLDAYKSSNYGIVKVIEGAPTYLVEYSSPNTNKPIHLGHLRNNFLGYSVAEILKASGKNVKKVQIINDRGIHICKSMVAWQEFGNKETPSSTNMKGDHLVGKYYVEFEKHYKKQIAELIALGMNMKEAEKEAPIYKKAQEMLIKWEANDVLVRNLWKKMTSTFTGHMEKE